jgi:hypothetical protein
MRNTPGSSVLQKTSPQNHRYQKSTISIAFLSLVYPKQLRFEQYASNNPSSLLVNKQYIIKKETAAPKYDRIDAFYRAAATAA